MKGGQTQEKYFRQGPVNYLRNLNLADTSVLQVGVSFFAEI